MKYIITYTARRKNARRHVYGWNGKTKYFNSVEEAKQDTFFDHPLYDVEILTANYKPIEK